MSIKKTSDDDDDNGDNSYNGERYHFVNDLMAMKIYDA